MTIGAFAIIQNEHGRFLLSHRRDLDMWNLPGGGLESMEAPWNAVVREVREGTGLEVTVKRLVGVYTKAGTDAIVFSLLCFVSGGQLRLTDEADEHRYFASSEIPRKHSLSQIDRLRDFVRAPEEATLKVQSFLSTREYLATLGRGAGPHLP